MRRVLRRWVGPCHAISQARAWKAVRSVTAAVVAPVRGWAGCQSREEPAARSAESSASSSCSSPRISDSPEPAVGTLPDSSSTAWLLNVTSPPSVAPARMPTSARTAGSWQWSTRCRTTGTARFRGTGHAHGALPRSDIEWVRRGDVGSRSVLLPGRPEGVPRPRLLRGAAEPVRGPGRAVRRGVRASRTSTATTCSTCSAPTRRSAATARARSQRISPPRAPGRLLRRRRGRRTPSTTGLIVELTR